MTDIIETTLLNRISELQSWIQWMETITTDYDPDIKASTSLLAHLRRELQQEQRNLRLRQYQNGKPRVIEVVGKVRV